MKYMISILLFVTVSINVSAQNDPEFPKEFIMHLRLHQGMVTDFHSTSPDIYVVGLQAVPQYTFVQNLLRGGVIADVLYTGKKLQLAGGPTISVKLKTLYGKPFGSIGNISLNLDHLWGTEKQQLAGGGITLDLANKIIIGIHAHRDYALNTWWLQNTLAIRISKLRKKTIIDL
jgi:hypothetical protein